MRVFKFGGASVKDADGVKNLVDVLKVTGHKDVMIVVSAMGKTTNAIENILKLYFEENGDYSTAISDLEEYHHAILNDLFNNNKHEIFRRLRELIIELNGILDRNKSPDYNFVYDQVIGYGEIISTTIISTYLNEIGLINTWLDVRDIIKTDNYYRRANVNWELTKERVEQYVDRDKLNVTQGFLGSDPNNFTTSLGREGSDYTAAIFAYCLNADSVTIWKDVPGVLNADPRYFEKTQLINKISYREAIELAFYGASVIHPKTLQPLQGKEIPLFVRSFLNPEVAGTMVGKGIGLEPDISCFILKKNQVLISLSSLDFSYIVEENISEIFSLLHLYKMKVDVIQNSAISFSVCVDDNYGNLQKLLQHLRAKFKVSYDENVSLYTIRHYTEEAIKQLEVNKTVLLKQLAQQTVQLVTK